MMQTSVFLRARSGELVCVAGGREVRVGWRERTWTVGFKHAADVQKVTDEGSSRESAAMLYWAHARAQGASNAVL